MDMPAFAANLVSDADVTQIYNYFKGGVSSNAPTCMSTGRRRDRDDASRQLLGSNDFLRAALHLDNTSKFAPISKVDPTIVRSTASSAAPVACVFATRMEDT